MTTLPTMPQLGEIIPDGAIDIFPNGHYMVRHLLADDGSRRIVQGRADIGVSDELTRVAI